MKIMKKIKHRSTKFDGVLPLARLSGAANRIRTGDLVLTKDVLCLLSHSSIGRGRRT